MMHKSILKNRRTLYRTLERFLMRCTGTSWYGTALKCHRHCHRGSRYAESGETRGNATRLDARALMIFPWAPATSAHLSATTKKTRTACYESSQISRENTVSRDIIKSTKKNTKKKIIIIETTMMVIYTVRRNVRAIVRERMHSAAKWNYTGRRYVSNRFALRPR